MTPQIAFDPYILEQASCRASLLVFRSGLQRDDWEDLRQDMVLDCLERLPRFNSRRGNFHAFVRGVIRNESAALAWRECRRFHCHTLPEMAEDHELDADGALPFAEPASADPSNQLALSADVQRVIATLPERLRILALDLAEMTVPEIAAKWGTSTQWIYEKRKKLRRKFIEAGVTPESMRRLGGGQ
jgi:RNA polymerase sigma-70 factor (ECF subfamily)